MQLSLFIKATTKNKASRVLHYSRKLFSVAFQSSRLFPPYYEMSASLQRILGHFRFRDDATSRLQFTVPLSWGFPTMINCFFSLLLALAHSRLLCCFLNSQYPHQKADVGNIQRNLIKMVANKLSSHSKNKRKTL